MKNRLQNIIKNTGHLIDLWLSLKIKYDKTPGLSVGIVHKGQLVYSRGFGFADIEKKIRPDETVLYHIASISKTFTAVAVMQLVERNKLRLEDKVVDYIDWFKTKNKNKDSKNITIRQLLYHSAGLFRDGNTPHWETGNFPDNLKNSFTPESLTIENATGFKYTNYGFSLLGLIIEKVSGVGYSEYIRKNILKPLGMESTVTDYLESLKNVATGYGRDIPDEERRIFEHYKTKAYAPATGFLSNVVDLAKYISIFSLNSKDKILGRESKKEMMRPHEYTEDGDSYGLGIDITYINKKKVVGHGGGFNGFITNVLIDPELELGVIVLTNSLFSSAGGITTGIFNLIYDGLENPSEHTGKLPTFSKYEGIYRNVWGDSVIAQFGKNLLEFSPGNSYPLKQAVKLKKEKTPNVFIMKDKNVFSSYNEKAVFKDFESGKAQTYVSGSMPSKRVKTEELVSDKNRNQK